MAKYASKMVELAQSWVGIEEGSAGHKEILAIYNSQKPLPRGYKMTTRDAWCAATTTALAVKLGYTDIVPCECSCNKLIEIAKEMGIWIEDESITPTPGMLCLYDWDDSGKGDNRGVVEHVGVVEIVGGGEFVVIEGNADINRDGKDGVERRPLAVNGRYLRGFIAPKYDAEETKPLTTTPAAPTKKKAEGYEMNMRNLSKGCTGEDVRALQILLKGRGYNCGNADGIFGSNTDSKVRSYQNDHGLTVDGICGPCTMGSLLGV